MSVPTTCINVDVDYFTHPKTLRLIGLLGKGAEVFPIRLWCWCAKYHAESGLLAGYSVQEIESCVGWTGESGHFVQAMIKVGLMEENELGFYVHDFTSLNGHIAAFKERARKANDARWAGIRAEKAQTRTPSRTPTEPLKESLKDSPNERTNYPTTATASPSAEAADVDNSKPKDEEPAVERVTAVPAAPGQDLEQVLYDRIGWKNRLSRFDMDKVLELKKAHPNLFWKATDRLHGGVKNVPAFLEKVVLMLAKEQVEPPGGKKCKKCGLAWDPWKTGKSLCPVCYPENGKPAAQITQLVSGLAAQMGRTA